MFPRPIQAVVFDLDGLLIDTESGFRDSLFAAAADRGCDVPLSLFHQIIGVPITESVKTLQAHLGPDIDADALYTDCWHRFHETIDLENILKAGVLEVLDHLDELRLPRAIATSSPRDAVDRHLGPSGVIARIDAIVARGEYPRSKPAPDPYQMAAARLGIDPTTCLALEDSHNGVRAAHAAGMMTIMVPDLLTPTEEMHEKCIHIAQTLHEVHDLLRAHGPAKG